MLDFQTAVEEIIVAFRSAKVRTFAERKATKAATHAAPVVCGNVNHSGKEAMKSTVDEIRQRFDADVERFSNLNVGQSAAVDSPLTLELVARAAAATSPHARHVLDVGCGAGNYTLKLLQHLPNLDLTLIDLSRPMLDRAVERVREVTSGSITAIQGDIREIALAEQQFDIVLAAAVLHHLRTDAEWQQVFQAFYLALRPGGSVWIVDLVDGTIPAVRQIIQQRYGEYLTNLRDDKYRDEVLAYIEKEDTPRPLMYQLDLLRQAGFVHVEVLHKNLCFAAFGALKDRKEAAETGKGNVPPRALSSK